MRVWESHSCCGCSEASGQGNDVAGPSQWLVVLQRAVPLPVFSTALSWLPGLCTQVEAGACCHPALPCQHCPEQLPGRIGCIYLHERRMQCSCTPEHQRRCPQEAPELALREEGTQCQQDPVQVVQKSFWVPCTFGTIPACLCPQIPRDVSSKQYCL